MKNEFENARPLNIQQWSDFPAVDAAVDAIFEEIMALGAIQRVHERMKDCLRVVILEAYVCYQSDTNRYLRHSRDNNMYRIDQYNRLEVKPERLRKMVDWLSELGYLTLKGGFQTDYMARQSRMRATDKLIQRINGFGVSPLMVAKHPDAEVVLLKDSNKKLIKFIHTPETVQWREALRGINELLGKTLINLYMSDAELRKLNRRLARVDDNTEDVEDEEPRGAIDFTQKSLCMVFNNSSFRQGGRLYGGWWQGVPREHRHRIRINHMNTIEVDFSAMHLNLIYWLEDLPVPDDPYILTGFPEGTRDVVKKCLLTMINAKNRKSAMRSIKDRINGKKRKTRTLPDGRKVTTEKAIRKKDRIILPSGIAKVEDIIDAFEEKHAAVQHWFFSGKGVDLQYWDSRVALQILRTMARHGVPCLPLHDSFIVSHPQADGLREMMFQAFHEVTDRYPKVDQKFSLIDTNRARPVAELEAEFRAKMVDGQFSDDFRREYSQYVGSIEEWKRITGRDNRFLYDRGHKLNREVYR